MAKNSLRRRLKDEEALKDEQIKKLQQKIGELVVENDVLQEAINPYSFAAESHPHCSECIWNSKWQESGTEESHRKDRWDGEAVGAMLFALMTILSA